MAERDLPVKSLIDQICFPNTPAPVYDHKLRLFKTIPAEQFPPSDFSAGHFTHLLCSAISRFFIVFWLNMRPIRRHHPSVLHSVGANIADTASGKPRCRPLSRQFLYSADIRQDMLLRDEPDLAAPPMFIRQNTPCTGQKMQESGAILFK